jgi:hypothetical protein
VAGCCEYGDEPLGFGSSAHRIQGACGNGVLGALLQKKKAKIPTFLVFTMVKSKIHLDCMYNNKYYV